jgi:hypothetical protein
VFRTIFAAAAVSYFAAHGAVQAATLSGTFSVLAVNAQNQNAAQSEALQSALGAAFTEAQNGTAGYAFDEFLYTGDLDFSTNAGTATTIAGWLATGVNGVVVGLDAAFGALQLSKGDVFADPATGTTTFFAFSPMFEVGPSTFTIQHDDGIAVEENGVRIGGFPGPNTERTTVVSGFSGGDLRLIYVATNADPSILKVDVAPIPLPAALPMLVAGLAGLGVLRLRRKAA